MAVRLSIKLEVTKNKKQADDQLISMLGIVIEDAGKGLWRLRSEPVTNLRESKHTQRW